MYRHSTVLHPRKALCINFLRPSGFYQIQRNAKTTSAATISRFLGTSYRKVLAGTFIIFGAYVVYEYRNFKTPLDIKSFLPFVLQSKERVSPTSSIFTLVANFKSIDENKYSNIWDEGIWSIQVKQPQIQIARSYTPLPPIHTKENEDESNVESLRFYIRREPRGEVSGYLHNLPLGANVALRGPHLEYVIPQDVDEVLFIAGGTGIAPGLQAAFTLLERRESVKSSFKMHILWANRTKEEVPFSVSDTTKFSANKSSIWRDLLWATPLPIKDNTLSKPFKASLVRELEIMKARHKGKLMVDYFIDEEGSYITESVLKTCLINLENRVTRTSENSSPGRKLILISGPEGFIKHFAGPKLWAAGRETQGALGGIMKTINPSHWEIWKL